MRTSSSSSSRLAGAYTIEGHLLHDVARLGRPADVIDRLTELTEVVGGRWSPAFARHASALVAHQLLQLERVADEFAALGAMLLAADAALEAARVYRRVVKESSRRATATRSAARAAQCEGVGDRRCRSRRAWSP